MRIGNWTEAQLTVKDTAAKAVVFMGELEKAAFQEGGGQVPPGALHGTDHPCAWRL